MEQFRGTTITDLQSAVQKVDGLFECTCGRYVPTHVRVAGELQENYITSDVLPESKFCSVECRNEAEQASEDARHV